MQKKAKGPGANKHLSLIKGIRLCRERSKKKTTIWSSSRRSILNTRRKKRRSKLWEELTQTLETLFKIFLNVSVNALWTDYCREMCMRRPTVPKMSTPSPVPEIGNLCALSHRHHYEQLLTPSAVTLSYKDPTPSICNATKACTALSHLPPNIRYLTATKFKNWIMILFGRWRLLSKRHRPKSITVACVRKGAVFSYNPCLAEV